jgi:hypothetical protein
LENSDNTVGCYLFLYGLDCLSFLALATTAVVVDYVIAK